MANTATHRQPGGVRGRDKQQDSLRDDANEQGVVRDQRGQDQPKDRERAQRTAGQQAQKASAQSQPQSPGQPAGGE